MKHVKLVTKTAPRRSAAWQDVVCESMLIVGNLIEAKGGNQPIVSWINGKCDLPAPNP